MIHFFNDTFCRKPNVYIEFLKKTQRHPVVRTGIKNTIPTQSSSAAIFPNPNDVAAELYNVSVGGATSINYFNQRKSAPPVENSSKMHLPSKDSSICQDFFSFTNDPSFDIY